MPGRLFLTTRTKDIATWMGADENGVEDPPRRNVAPGEDIVVFANGLLQHMRWGLIPTGRVNARCRPVMETLINARSETVFSKSAFEGVRRAIVPADGWYEWTGDNRKKQAWRIRRKDGRPLAFAAIFDVWKAPGGVEVAQVATVTCEPNDDLRQIHHRMGVLLSREHFQTWLRGSEEAAALLMRPLENGKLATEQVDDVDWSVP